MDAVILEFVSCCRANGMRISTAETLDCLAQLNMAGPLNEQIFYTVLKANFAKSRREQDGFSRLYRLFFHDMKKGLPKAGEATENSGEPLRDAPDLDHRLRQMAEQDEYASGGTEQALLAFMAGEPRAFVEAVREIHDQETRTAGAVKSNLGQLTGRLEIMLAANRIRQQVPQFLGSMEGVPDEDQEVLLQQAGQRLDRALAFLNEEPAPDNPGLVRTGETEQRFSHLGNIPFANLTRDETARVQDVIDQWVRKMEDVATLRFAAARKGAVDVKRTIQRSTRYLGVPVEIVRKDRPLRKGKIVTLCDVSGSVWSTARFMLNILYSLQACFARVKSHVFIDCPLEVTGLFLAHEANTAVKKILNDDRINYNARTDYGLTFQKFRDDHLSDLDKKTTLIIMGDGRSNYFNPREPVLELLRERCRRLVWLNPESRRFWGTGDSEMLRYRRYCNDARPCGNLNQLLAFIQDLVL